MGIYVEIEGIGTVSAILVQRYPDGDVRVMYKGLEYVCKPVVGVPQ